MKKSFLALVIATTVGLSGCSTIVFDNVPVAESPASDWVTARHQIGGIFELYEFQQPKNLDKLCEGKQWEHIATHTTFMDGLIRHLVPYGIYAPKTTYTKCSNVENTVSSN